MMRQLRDAMVGVGTMAVVLAVVVGWLTWPLPAVLVYYLAQQFGLTR